MNTSLSRLQSFYSDFRTPLLLHAMIKREFPGNIALLSFFGADAPLLAMVAEVEPAIPVLFLDTGAHAPETLDYVKQLTHRLELPNVKWLTLDPSRPALWNAELNRAVEAMGLLALITGRRRAGLPKIEIDGNGVFRINPLADWTKEEQNSEMIKYNIPAHPLAGGLLPPELDLEEEPLAEVGTAAITGPVNWSV